MAFDTPGVPTQQDFVLTVESGLRSINRRLEDAVRSLGAGGWMVFRRVTLPLVWPSLAAGTVLTWAGALGEFGATITFAGNLPGVTQNHAAGGQDRPVGDRHLPSP